MTRRQFANGLPQDRAGVHCDGDLGGRCDECLIHAELFKDWAMAPCCECRPPRRDLRASAVMPPAARGGPPPLLGGGDATPEVWVAS